MSKYSYAVSAAYSGGYAQSPANMMSVTVSTGPVRPRKAPPNRMQCAMCKEVLPARQMASEARCKVCQGELDQRMTELEAFLENRE